MIGYKEEQKRNIPDFPYEELTNKEKYEAQVDDFFSDLGRMERVKHYDRIIPCAEEVAHRRIQNGYWSEEVGKAYVEIVKK